MLAMITAALLCVDPAQHGAKPDDGASDRAAFQAAIDDATIRGIPVCVGPGIWEIDRSRAIASLVIAKGPLEIRGSGEISVLRMTGDGRRGDWRGIEIRGARNVVIRDIAIDGLGAFNTEEQTHLLEIGAGSENVIVKSVVLGPMRRREQRLGDGIGGDCIRLLGTKGIEVRNVAIVDVRFERCDRSGITFQRALRNIAVVRSSSHAAGDTPIDFEPTGTGSIENVVLSDLDLLGSPGWAVTLSGHAAEPARNIRLTNSRLQGGVWLLSVVDSEISNNTITDRSMRPDGTISMARRIENVVFKRNRIRRDRAAAAAPLFRLTHNNGVAPRSVEIASNTLEQETAAPVVSAYSLSSLSLLNNDILYRSTESRTAIVQVEAIAGSVRRVRIVGNQVGGAATRLLSVRARSHHVVEEVEVQGNRVGAHMQAFPLCEGKSGQFKRVATDVEAEPRSCAGAELRALTRVYRVRPPIGRK